MADNDIYVIKRIIKCFTTTDETISERDRRGYEYVIADTIYKAQFVRLGEKSLLGIITESEYESAIEDIKTESKDLAKAVVDRLFGEGE